MRSIIDEDIIELTKNINFSSLNEKSILVTGASGLLGVYFIATLRHLISQDFKIKIFATHKSELSVFLKRQFDFKGIELFQGDITEAEFSNSLPQADFIIHAAGYGQPIKFMGDPVSTLKLNTFSTFLLFNKLKSGGHFLFVSSSEIYSGLKPGKHSEIEIGTSNTTNVRSCYIEGKRGGEAICNAFRYKGVHASSVRLSHTYGPGVRFGDKRVLMALIEKGLMGEINLLDSGAARRSYCYVSDAVEMMWYILMYGQQPVYNVAGKSKTTISELAKLIGEEMKVPVRFPVEPLGIEGAPEDVELDTTLIETESGKSNYKSLGEGLKQTIQWYKTTAI